MVDILLFIFKAFIIELITGPRHGWRARLSSVAVRGAYSAASVEHTLDLQLGLARFVRQYPSTKRDSTNCQVEAIVRLIWF